MKTAAIAAAGIALLSSVFFKKRQDRAKIGGKIAWSKSLWLHYTLLCWFILPILLQWSSSSPDLKSLLSILGISMWIRGVAEMFMMFKTKNWNPVYGISHDLFTIAALLAGAVLYHDLKSYEGIYFGSLIAGLCLETYYAWFFLKHVGKKTQGDEAVWFASKENPMFAKVLKVTTAGNVLVFLGLGYFLAKLDH